MARFRLVPRRTPFVPAPKQENISIASASDLSQYRKSQPNEKPETCSKEEVNDWLRLFQKGNINGHR